MRQLYLHYLHLLIVVLGFLVSFQTVGEQRITTDFFVGMEDIPRMPLLQEDEAASVIFDNPAGRWAEVYGFGQVSKTDVLRFYQETLPQLGWKETSLGTFAKGQEILSLEFFSLSVPETESSSQPGILVQFTIRSP